jgi:hypothetical protein
MSRDDSCTAAESVLATGPEVFRAAALPRVAPELWHIMKVLQ